MKTIYSTPVLESVTSRGLRKFWQGHVCQEDNNFYTQTTFWQITQDGEESVKQSSTPYKVTGKNSGKKNATTDQEQALREMASTVKKQLDKGYHEIGSVTDILPLPMLAHSYEDRKHALRFPASVQPKLDGCRCLSKGGRKWSRQGKDFIAEVVAHLHFDTENYIIDGELLLPAEFSFQDSMKAIKKFRPESSPLLKYHVYDVIIDQPFPERYELLKRLVEKAPENVQLVQTHVVESESDIFEHHVTFTSAGFEGTIIRSHVGGYTVGQRSVQLLKHKDFLDREYVILDVVCGSGKDQDCAIFVCETDEKVIFNVRPEGSLQDRKEMYINRGDYVGKQLTVRFQNLSEDNVPRFPVGIGVRD